MYVIGRPLMAVIWALALWGTGIGARLLWLMATRGTGVAIGFLRSPMVSVPLVLAVFMWIALILAVRRFRGGGPP